MPLSGLPRINGKTERSNVEIDSKYAENPKIGYLKNDAFAVGTWNVTMSCFGQSK
jgi:hypothetical protein